MAAHGELGMAAVSSTPEALRYDLHSPGLHHTSTSPTRTGRHTHGLPAGQCLQAMHPLPACGPVRDCESPRTRTRGRTSPALVQVTGPAASTRGYRGQAAEARTKTRSAHTPTPTGTRSRHPENAYQ